MLLLSKHINFLNFLIETHGQNITLNVTFSFGLFLFFPWPCQLIFLWALCCPFGLFCFSYARMFLGESCFKTVLGFDSSTNKALLRKINVGVKCSFCDALLHWRPIGGLWLLSVLWSGCCPFNIFPISILNLIWLNITKTRE